MQFIYFRLWATLHCVTNVIFMTIGLSAAHHHLDIFHEGDAPLLDSDWGLHQIVATKEKYKI